MSELSLGTLSGLAANSYVIDVAAGSSLDLSAGAVLPTGSILQVVSTTKTDTFTTTTTSLTDITGLSATITPRSTSSKIIILVHTASSYVPSGSSGGMLSIFRDGTNLSNPASSGVREKVFTGFDQRTTNQAMVSTSATYSDSPASTSTLTYSVKVRSQAGGTIYINRSVTDADNTATARAVSTITLMEVAG